MKRFSTAPHEFQLSVTASQVKRLNLTYYQGDRLVLKKRKEDMTADGHTWKITLTQEETGRFSEGIASAQLHGLLTSGESLHTEEMLFFVEDVQDEEVLV